MYIIKNNKGTFYKILLILSPINDWKIMKEMLIFRNRASYIKDGHTATLQTPHFIYFFNKYPTEYFKHAA
jgi:hypothetical protein